MINNCRVSLVVLAIALPAWGLGCARAQTEHAREFQGLVEFEEIELGFEYGGRLQRLSVRRGDRVEAGESIGSIDASLEQAATEARLSETEAARASVQLTRAGSRPEEIRALEARIRAAEASMRRLSEALGRERRLLAEGVSPSAVVDELGAELDRAQAERDALAHQLRLLREGPRREEVAVQQARADTSLALLRAQRERQERYELLAPIAGDVLDHHRLPGEVVAAGAPIVTLADTAHPFAEVFVPQAELAGIALGAAASVWVDALAEPLSGRVEHVARRTEFTPRYLFSERERANLVVRVRVRIDDGGRALHAGVPARVRFEEARGEPAGG